MGFNNSLFKKKMDGMQKDLDNVIREYLELKVVCNDVFEECENISYEEFNDYTRLQQYLSRVITYSETLKIAMKNANKELEEINVKYSKGDEA